MAVHKDLPQVEPRCDCPLIIAVQHYKYSEEEWAGPAPTWQPSDWPAEGKP